MIRCPTLHCVYLRLALVPCIGLLQSAVENAVNLRISDYVTFLETKGIVYDQSVELY